MGAARLKSDAAEMDGEVVPLDPGEVESEPVKAWELIDTGRYMPRRIRGSYRGRELG
jgi:hypothetical protein